MWMTAPILVYAILYNIYDIYICLHLQSFVKSRNSETKKYISESFLSKVQISIVSSTFFLLFFLFCRFGQRIFCQNNLFCVPLDVAVARGIVHYFTVLLFVLFHPLHYYFFLLHFEFHYRTEFYGNIFCYIIICNRISVFLFRILSYLLWGTTYSIEIENTMELYFLL